jgi:hypothetical protein
VSPAAAPKPAAAASTAVDAYKAPVSGIVGQHIKIWWPEENIWVFGRVAVSGQWELWGGAGLRTYGCLGTLW